jgi:hypothetical protein
MDAKKQIRAGLQASRIDDADLGEAVVIGYAAVAEWMTPDGTRWLSLTTGDATDEELMRWQVQGYFYNVLNDPAWEDDDGPPDS